MPEFRLPRQPCFWQHVMIDLITVLSPHLTPPVVSQILLLRCKTLLLLLGESFPGQRRDSGVGCSVRWSLLRDSPSQLANINLMPIGLHSLHLSLFFFFFSYVSAVLLYGLSIFFVEQSTLIVTSIYFMNRSWQALDFKSIFGCGRLSEALLSPCPPTIFLRLCMCLYTLQFFQVLFSSGLSTSWWRYLGNPACWEP